MRLPRVVVVACLPALLALTGCDRTRIVTQQDAGPICDTNQRLVNGECRFVCQRDGDCAAGQRCSLLSGQCEPKPPEPDAGPRLIPCTQGAERCAADSHSVELCGADGGWGLETACPQPDGFCQNEQCLACRPGAARCTASSAAVEICLDDGSAWRTVTCAATATCVNNECRECAPGQKRCSPDGHSVQECQRRPAEDLTWAFVNVGDNFDGTCITQVCETPATGPQCRPPACVPGVTQCLNSATQQVCSATGSYTNVTCATQPNMGPTAECLNGTCVDECADAAAAKSYFGCEYWTAVMDNVTTASMFKGGTTSGQGTTDSEYAFVVTNRSTAPTVVTITRWRNSAVETVKTVTVPSRLDVATKGLAVIHVPWQSIGTDTDYTSTSGLQRYGYRLTTTHPVTVYQFNPLSAFKTQGSCTTASNCPTGANDPPAVCVNNQCNYYAYSNDASLLLPAHILGLSYVGLTPEHVMARTGTVNGAASIGFNGQLTIVGTEASTTVTVRASAKTRAGVGGVGSIDPGATRTFTLQPYDVLQIASDNPTATPQSINLECGDSPYNDPLCSLLGNCEKFCRIDSDLTGTIVTADKKIAVFGGSTCTLRGYLDTACDHMEEQLFPFATWGKQFVATRTAPLRLTSNAFATTGNAGPDYYKIVAGCPASTCPNGTLLTLTPPPAAGDVLSSGARVRCSAGTSLANNTCRLAGGAFVEFRSKTSFTISADQPIAVAQMFAGQDATAGTDRPAQGDPSLVLLPPVEQWRSQYTVLTAPGIKDNYLGLVIDSTKVLNVIVNGTVVGGFQSIGSTPFKMTNLPVPVGTHTISVTPQPGQTTIPGAGVTVYGFDSYVSYGYTGGLDLSTLVTGINPGG